MTNKPKHAKIIVTRFIDDDELVAIERPEGAVILVSPNAARTFLDKLGADGFGIDSVEGEQYIPTTAGRTRDDG